MKVAFVASECAPFAKVGGLGDVIGALPKALVGLDVEPIIILPYYKSIETFEPRPTNLHPLIVGDDKTDWSVFELALPNSDIKVFFLRHPLFWTDNIYGSANDSFRFASFSLAAVGLSTQLDVDVFHCHDWHTGLIPYVLGQKLPTMMTIHNVHPGTGMGQISSAQLTSLGVRVDNFISTSVDKPSSFSLLAQGVNVANSVTTVSPTYAEEIKTEPSGGPLAELFRRRSDKLEGIVNGIDTKVFDPATDPHIATHFSAEDISGKTGCRNDLETTMGWERSDQPILGIVTRLTSQKGIDLIVDILPQLVELQTRVVVLGSGEPKLETELAIAAKKYPANLKVFLRFDAPLAQKIYAGADLFLMPSRFEPCGLGQMIAMRYGTLPVVNKTGGLADTVSDNETGFVFSPLSAANLLTTIKRAIASRDRWQTMQQLAMHQDFSWTKSAKLYRDIYQRLVKN